MKISNSFMLVAALFFSLIPTGAHAKAKDYVLQCRGGGSMYARVFINIHNYVTIYGMKHSKFAAGAHAPGPGECAWLDRPLANNEPYKISYGQKTEKLIEHVDVSSKNVNLAWKRAPIAEVIEKMRTGNIFYVHVKNIGSALKITRIGP